MPPTATYHCLFRRYASWREAPVAFTLMELLVVMAIMVSLMVLTVPAFNSIKNARSVSRVAYDIVAVLDNARSYAMANNTYVFVGFVEVDASVGPEASPQKYAGASPYGRVAVAAVASRDGTRGYDINAYNRGGDENSWANHYANGGNLMALAKLQHFENMHIADFGAPPNSGSMARTSVTSSGEFSYSLGSPLCVSQTPFSWPLGSVLGGGQYYFQKVINFDPQGVARIQASNNGDVVTQCIEIDLQQTHGAVKPALPDDQNSGNHVVIQIDCITSQTHIYRP